MNKKLKVWKILLFLISFCFLFFTFFDSTVQATRIVKRCDSDNTYYVYSCEEDPNPSGCDYSTILPTATGNESFCCTLLSQQPNSTNCPLGTSSSEDSTVTLSPNPELPAGACGLDIALVLDVSGSIEGTNISGELMQMKDAFKSFVRSLEGTPTWFSVTQFSAEAKVKLNFTNDITAVLNAIDNCDDDSSTNWEDAFDETWSTFDPRPEENLVIFSSDGNANRSNSSSLTPIDAAIVKANIIKESGTRIFGMGIGNNLNENYLKAVTGDNTDSPDLLSRDLVFTDFDQMASEFSKWAVSACGGTVTINKYLEKLDGSTQAGSGWNYQISGQEDLTLTTGSEGSVNTADVISRKLEEGVYSIVETNLISSNYSFESAECRIDGEIVGEPIDNGVSGIEITHDDIVICDFINKENPPNIKPSVDSIVVQREAEDTVYGYDSETHTGEELNNRVLDSGESAKTEVIANFSDQDGIEDLKALAIWWSADGSDFLAPDRLGDLPTNGTKDNENFGIMIKRDVATDEFTEVYIPDYSTNYSWDKGGITSDTVYILGPDGKRMVEISNFEITESEMVDGKYTKIEVRFLIKFFTTNDADSHQVSTSSYDIYGAAYDELGFVTLPDGKVILTADDWYKKDSWNVDLIDPRITGLSLVHNDNNTVTVTVTGDDRDDSMKVSTVRLDACITGVDAADADPLKIGTQEYVLRSCSENIMDRMDFSQSNSLLGDKGMNINAGSFNINQIVDLQNNAKGSITFYLTVMDYAGNYEQNNANVPPLILVLGDWFIVEDGLVFGGEGVESPTRSLTATVDWAYSPLDIFTKSLADITNHVLLGGQSVTPSDLGDLIHYNSTASFKASKYKGVYDSSVFDDLVNAYEAKSVNTKYGEKILTSSSISGNLLDSSNGNCNTTQHDYCTLISSDNLSIEPAGSDPFECNYQGLIIVNGDLDINTNFVNEGSDDACIILVSGNVNITIPQNNNVSDVDYDYIESFIIAGGEIKINEDTNNDGLYVEGGLVGLTTTPISGNGSIANKRDIVPSKMQSYPVIAVKCRSKYGLLARKLFGTPIDVFKTEVGFKPY
jgi:hypothetical protein